MAVRRLALRPYVIAGLAALTISLGACQDGSTGGGVPLRALAPVPQKTLALMAQKGMSPSDPILIRAYKKEAEMEVWKRGTNGQYALLKTFPICRWSGQLGPKTKQGDRQAPEGFYTVTPGQMNPNSSYYLSFDTGYPNAYDRANGRSGNYIMVHGTCSSAGCFAMTDESMGEIYALARDSFAGGQRAFQFQSYPFRMTAANVAKFRNDPNAPFWKNLKEGSDYFEALREEPKVGLCGTRYVFGGADAAAGACTPRVDPLVAEKRDRDNREVADLIAKGTPATRLVYEDGTQNPVFRSQPPSTATAFANLIPKDEPEQPYDPKEYARHHLGEVSRPETVAAAREIEVDAKGRPVMLAAAEAPIPTKAAAQGKAAVGVPKKGSPATLMAKVDPVAEPAPAKPARVMVADAEDDPAAFKKALSHVLGTNPAPATPATDAATIPAAVAADPAPAKLTPKAPAKLAHAGQVHAATAPAAKAKAATVATADAKVGKPGAKTTGSITKAPAAKD
ncbi:L,D-transpeptidase family protein [Methylobacterium adhaesivum]|jgi:murein L,D-transpeptidase YafK|uniref:L,D-transpeptidase family protein n=1 Tax=Methylobacterium adhaesivum TaxID=333297 RepID=A0ABT8BPE0_9HYPH|nr:L,D-transpeptidase family protein [Methylobacterium adhaesivum]MDN3593196.1 L,D-transpeptidase family protein [Methylobacterium adhaesivum]